MGFEQLGVRLNDAGYKNWLKAGYCLLRVRDALHGYLDNEMKRFHRGLLSANPALRSGQRCRGACKPRGTQVSHFPRPVPACGQWRTEILRHHTNRAGQVHWGNCRPWLWPFQHWELAKAYMPRGQAKITRPDQCDAAALLNLINFCDHFSFIEQRAVREVIRHRNELMHSSEMKVSAQWMTHFHGSLDRLLLQLRHVPGIAAAAQEIQEILSVDWSVSIPGSDRVDGAQREGLEPERISHVETQLLRERLQELLLCTDGQAPPDPQVQ
uniref:Chromosome X open reading frame 38 n=1 Tax=Scleropages formosus TaxID=113540 RepID=A0A8C9SI04_SCLFO